MKKIFILLLAVQQINLAYAGDGKYAVNKISPFLLINANAVLRMEHETFEIFSADEAKHTKHYAITILNENAADWANFLIQYDSFREIQDVDGYLYNKDGNEINRLKNKEVNDYSANDGSFANDNRIKQHNFSCKIYPYTIEYKLVFKHKNNTMFFPYWMPQSSPMFSVENSDITIIAPTNYEVRYKAFNYKQPPVELVNGNKKTLTWQVKNLQAFKLEKFMPRWNEVVTSVLFGPSNFEVQNYKGNLQSWKDFGLFCTALKQGRDELPENVKAAVQQLTNGLTNTFQKVDALYQYMQKNTRYISVQLGIGGWQPFDATYVASKGYGDCKALSNYMYSLLKQANIPSIYTKVKSGDDEQDIIVDFPASQFDHIILCVPNNSDTIWLECTNQTLPTGYLGAFTANRHVLLVDGENSKIVKTPKYSASHNKQIRKINATLNDEASLAIQAVTQYHCVKQDDVHGMINHLSKEKIKEKLSQNLSFATYQINNFSYQENKMRYPIIEEKLDVNVSNYAAVTGKRLFIVPNIMTRVEKVFSQETERKFDIVMEDEFTEIDTVEITIPIGYELEMPIKEMNETSTYASYKSSASVIGNKIIYTRTFVQQSGRFPATEFSTIAAFYNKIFKADSNKMVFVKKE